MYWDTHRLVAPSGAVIATGKGPVMEDRFARLIEAEGYPTEGNYSLQCLPTPRREDDPRGPGSTRPYTLIGCDRDGWWVLDGSGVPATSGRPRMMHEQTSRIQREYGGRA